MRHATPAEDKRLAFEIITEAGRISLATAGDTATIAAIERALAAASRLRRLSASMETALRRQRAAAINAEREAARDAERAERRNDAIRRSRGLPTGSADLDKAVWLPKSQVEFEERPGGIVEVTLPEWLAIERGLA